MIAMIIRKTVYMRSVSSSDFQSGRAICSHKVLKPFKSSNGFLFYFQKSPPAIFSNTHNCHSVSFVLFYL